MRGWFIQAAILLAGWIAVYRFSRASLSQFRTVGPAKIIQLAEWRRRLRGNPKEPR